jgi:hypothetical protein
MIKNRLLQCFVIGTDLSDTAKIIQTLNGYNTEQITIKNNSIWLFDKWGDTQLPDWKCLDVATKSTFCVSFTECDAYRVTMINLLESIIKREIQYD